MSNQAFVLFCFLKWLCPLRKICLLYPWSPFLHVYEDKLKENIFSTGRYFHGICCTGSVSPYGALADDGSWCCPISLKLFFFSNFLKFWYHEQAHIFLINHSKFKQLESVWVIWTILLINENMPMIMMGNCNIQNCFVPGFEHPNKVK